MSLRAKLVLFFSGITVFTAGVALLFAFSPTRALGTMLGSVALAIALDFGRHGNRMGAGGSLVGIGFKNHTICQ